MTLNFNRVVGMYFSPTHTTKKVIEHIVEGTGIDNRVMFDFTLPKNRISFPEIYSDDLVIIGLPTYAGRLPNLLLKFLNTIEGNNSVAIPVVTFGNRAFDNSLYELKELLISHSFKILAAASFSCQHSFSDSLNKDRPDETDLLEAYNFGRNALSKEIKDDILVPGDLEVGYFKPKDRNGEPIDILKVKPTTLISCNKCNVCVEVCPMGVIDKDDPFIIKDPCIKCNACVKFCPIKSKVFDDEKYLYHKKELEFLYGFNRLPNTFYY